MKKIFSFLLFATAVAANAQQINGSFDAEWEDCYPWVSGDYITTARGKQPQGWRSSNVNGMKGQGAVNNLVTPTTGYNKTQNAALIQNAKTGAMGVEAWTPGYLTLGTPWNTAVGTSQKDGGTWGGLKFRYRPDAVSFYYKWDKKVAGKASFIGYMWKGTYEQTNVPTNVTLSPLSLKKVTMEDRDRNILNKTAEKGDKPLQSEGTLIASYEEYIEESATDWTLKTIKFNYKKNQTPEKINIIFSSSDYFSTNVSEGANPLTIDEVTLVYYKHLQSLTINGNTPANFDGTENADNTDKVTLDASTTEYTEDCIEATPAGAGATVAESYDPLTAKCNVVVTAGDGQTKTYEIQFKQVYNATPYNNSLLVSVSGKYSPISQNTIHLLSHKEKEQYGFVLEHFMFDGGDMGTIYVKDLAKTANADGSTTYKTPTYEEVFIEGLGGSVPVSVEATVDSKNQMTATINIPIEGMPVVVTFAPQLTISPSTSMEVTNAVGLTNVVMTREFKQGWNTYCMPFDYNLSSLNAKAKAQEFVSSNGYSLTFNAVNDNVLKANVPYLVYFPTETKVGTTEEPLYFVTNVASYQPTSVEYNGFTFVGNYEASKSMQGLYGVASEGDVQKIMLGTVNSTLPATCAYFTTKNLNANGLRICFDGGEVTGINQVNGAQAQSAGAVYNLQGIKVSNRGTNNLPAGLYIMQGKKVIVK